MNGLLKVLVGVACVVIIASGTWFFGSMAYNSYEHRRNDVRMAQFLKKQEHAKRCRYLTQRYDSVTDKPALSVKAELDQCHAEGFSNLQ